MTDEIPESFIKKIRMLAGQGVWRGEGGDLLGRAYFNRCRHWHPASGIFLIFTRDTGHHTSGWMKNPDFERCKHLSISFRGEDPRGAEATLASGVILDNIRTPPPVPFSLAKAKPWIDAIFYPNQDLVWNEGSFSDEGKVLGVSHFRLFCDEAWEAIHPRGEVYSTQFTEMGWRSWSEVQGEDAPKNWVDAE